MKLTLFTLAVLLSGPVLADTHEYYYIPPTDVATASFAAVTCFDVDGCDVAQHCGSYQSDTSEILMEDFEDQDPLGVDEIGLYKTGTSPHSLEDDEIGPACLLRVDGVSTVEIRRETRNPSLNFVPSAKVETFVRVDDTYVLDEAVRGLQVDATVANTSWLDDDSEFCYLLHLVGDHDTDSVSVFAEHIDGADHEHDDAWFTHENCDSRNPE